MTDRPTSNSADLRKVSAPAEPAEHAPSQLPTSPPAGSNDLRDRIERAAHELGEICRYGARNRFRMRIPADPNHDSDLILSDGLKAGEEALALIPAIEQRVRQQVADQIAEHRNTLLCRPLADRPDAVTALDAVERSTRGEGP